MSDQQQIVRSVEAVKRKSLDKEDKRGIAERAAAKRYDQELVTAKEDFVAACDEWYKHTHRGILPVVNALLAYDRVNELVDTNNRFQVYIDNRWTELEFSTPRLLNRHRTEINVKDSKQAKAVWSAMNKIDDLEKARKGLYYKVEATLCNYRSPAKLLADWPDALELLPDYFFVTPAQLPAQNFQELNKLLGIAA